MNNEITNIDRTLNPLIDYLKICVPRNVSNIRMTNLYDREGNKVPLIQELNIKLGVRASIMTCTGKRVLRITKNQVMLDSKREVMTEEFTCPCAIDTYDLETSFVAFDPSSNPTNKQLRDYLGCRVCGLKTDVMYNGKDGARCEKHRDQTTEILMLGP